MFRKMSEIVPFTPEQALRESREFTRQPKEEHLSEATVVVGEWADFWGACLSSSEQMDNANWKELITDAEQKAREIEQGLDEAYPGKELESLRQELKRINWVIGRIPRFISLHNQADRDREVLRCQGSDSAEKRGGKRLQRHFLALWQGEAVYAVGRLDEEAITTRGENGSDLLLDWFQGLCERRRKVRDPQEVAGVSLAGVFGCLAVADIALQSGYKVCLPPYHWDADNSIDLLIYRPEEKFPPSRVYPIQVKYRSRGDRGLTVVFEDDVERIAGVHEGVWREGDDDKQNGNQEGPKIPYSEVVAGRKFYWQKEQLQRLPGWEGIDLQPRLVYLNGEGWEKASYRRVLSGELGGEYAEEFGREIEKEGRDYVQ